MQENPERCYDPGYAAGRTFRLLSGGAVLDADTVVSSRLQSWSGRNFPAGLHTSAYRKACEDHFALGFRDGLAGRRCRGSSSRTAA